MSRRKYGSRHVSKVDMVMAMLATGIYRPWFWANYKEPAKQRLLRYEWDKAVSRFDRSEIKLGLERWGKQFGSDHPPTPQALADFIRPTHSTGSREFFAQVKQRVGEA